MEAFLDKQSGYVFVSEDIEKINISVNNIKCIIHNGKEYIIGSFKDINFKTTTYVRVIMLNKNKVVKTLAEWDLASNCLKLYDGYAVDKLIELYNSVNDIHHKYTVMLFKDGRVEAVFKTANEAMEHVKKYNKANEPFVIEVVSNYNNSTIIRYNYGECKLLRINVNINSDLKALYNYYITHK